MTVFLASTVRRHCPANEPSGYIYVVDPRSQRVIQRSAIIEPLFRELDKNPRGGMRGGKGISILPDQAALANFSMIFRYDPSWNLLGAITHPSCAGVHDIHFRDDGLWAAAARADLLLQFDFDGRLKRRIYLRQPSAAIEALGWRAPILLTDDIVAGGKIDFRDPREVVKETYDRAHVNSMCFLQNGDQLVSLGFVFDEKYAGFLQLKIRLIQLGLWPAVKWVNRAIHKTMRRKRQTMDTNLVVKPAQAKSALVRLSPDGERHLCLTLENMTAPSHSLLALPDDRVIYLNTTAGRILHIEPYTRQVLSDTQVATGGFLRGVTRLDERSLLLGNGGEMIQFSIPDCQVVERFTISTDAKEAIYDIKELPAHYALPPVSFAEDFTRQTGLDSPLRLLG